MKPWAVELLRRGLSLGLVLAALLPGSGAVAHPGAARVGVPVADVYAAPSFEAERVTQVLLWDEVRVEKIRGEWAKVVVPEQYRTPWGYPGWMPVRYLVLEPRPPAEPVAMVARPAADLHREPSAESPLLHPVYMGTRLPLASRRGEWSQVRLPTGETAWVATEALIEGPLPLDDGAGLLQAARRLEGTPYLWGGMTRRGIDCSGLTFMVCRLHGVVIPRDADQQFSMAGVPVSREELRPGDLVFFGSGPEEVTHVGFYLGDGQFYDSSGSRGVGPSRLDEPRWVDAWVGARRLVEPKTRDGEARPDQSPDAAVHQHGEAPGGEGRPASVLPQGPVDGVPAEDQGAAP